MAIATKNDTIRGRIRREIDVDGRPCCTLFDAGARNSTIRRDAARGIALRKLPQPRRSSLGGGVHDIEDVCPVLADVEGHRPEFQASVIDRIGKDEDGREIDLLFGALAMRLWGIEFDLPHERLDFTHFTTDFVEF